MWNIHFYLGFIYVRSVLPFCTIFKLLRKYFLLLCLYIPFNCALTLFARGVIDKSIWDNNSISHCTCNNLIGQVSPAKHLWLYDWETWNSLSLLSLSFCSILSSRRVPLTSLSFVPPGGLNGWRREPAGGRRGVGGMGGGGERGWGFLFLQGALMLI